MEPQLPKILPLPPIIYLVWTLLALGVNHFVKIHLFSDQVYLYAGLIILSVGSGICSLGFFQFGKTENPVFPIKQTQSLMTGGIYRFTRNPLYLGWMIGFIGAGLILHNEWFMILSVPLAIGMNKLVIIKEEKYLEEKFGKEYSEYKLKVRRWL